MKSFAVFAGLLVSTAVAQPHGHSHGRRHQHAHGHEKRALVTEWTTAYETVTVTEYVDETTTTWITPSADSASSTRTTTSTTATSSRTTVPGQFFEGASSSSKESPVYVQENTSAAVAVTETNTYVPPPPSSSTSVYTPPSPPPVAATPTPSAAPVQQTTGSSSSSSSSGGDTHHGDLTYYDVGMGACGWDDSGKDMTDNIVALSHIVMGAQSNGNPYCGKSITISYGGKTIQAIVRDKCMGCEADAIDVSKCAFIALMGSMDVGRKPVDWWFN